MEFAMQRDDCCEQPRGTVLTQVARNAAAGGTTHAGAHDLHRRHQRVREEHGPGQRITELRAGLRVGRKPARIVIGRARNQPGAQDSEQPRLGWPDDRAGSGIDGLFDFNCHEGIPDPAAPTNGRGGSERLQYETAASPWSAQWCSSMMRMISGMGIPTSQSRMGMLSLLSCF
jgi:hypothetical protein